jgi:hypothetical protein
MRSMNKLFIMSVFQIVAIQANLAFAQTKATAAMAAQPMALHNAPKAAADSDTACSLSILQWPGKKFVFLPKQKIVKAFGYGLYLTPELDRSKSPVNPARETKEHRIRCDAFDQGSLTVREVKPSGSEYLVHFIHEPTKVSLFAKTHRGAIEGLALAEDVEKAKKRWLGKTVYSMRRFINMYDSVTGNVSTQKVKTGDPLRVVEIRWGTTPLPSQPLWLVVETAPAHDAGAGTRGFIPVSISWANIMFDKITSGRPWDEDILEQDPKKLYAWDKVYWDAIDNHSIVPGMTKPQVRMSWGPAKTVRKDMTKAGNRELWSYDDGQELLFIGDSLASN